jgi:hypothetical protein
MFWKRKSKEEKILEKIREKKKEIDKLKEDVNNMAKLVLKDGKLQKVESATPPQKEIPTPPSPPDELNMNLKPKYSEEDMRREYNKMIEAIAPASMQQQYQQPQMAPQPPNYEPAPRQNPPQFVPPPQRPQFRQPQYAPVEEQPQYYQQPQQPQYRPQPEQVVQITIVLCNEGTLQFSVPLSALENYINTLNNAMEQSKVIVIEDYIVNARNIVMYKYE